MDDLSAPEPSSTELVVTYDIMWDAANFLRGLINQQVTVGGHDDPAIVRMRSIREEVEAVDPDDLAAQRAVTKRLHDEYDELSR